MRRMWKTLIIESIVDGKKVLQVPLSKKVSMIIDPENISLCNKPWHISHCGKFKYASWDKFNIKTKKKTKIRFHRLVMGLKKYNRNIVVDHINGNSLDNRKANLRLCTHSNNIRASRPHRTRKHPCPYKGVHLHSAKDKWVAEIKTKDKRIYLGRFSSQLEAAKAYNNAAKIHFGKFAYLNKIST